MDTVTHLLDGERRAAVLFVTYLKEASLSDWAAAASHNGEHNTRTATSALRTALSLVGNDGAVFETRQAVFDVLGRFDSPAGRDLARRRDYAEHLRPSTEHAALAVLMRKQLACDEFTALYGNFELLIPLALLFGIDDEPRR